jgi:hypothetical protein
MDQSSSKTPKAPEPGAPFWDLWAHDYGHCFVHIGSRRYVELHHIPDSPIVPIRLTECRDGAYYAWLRTGETAPSMIWPSSAQFSMCFAYGPEVEVARGKGIVLRLSAALRESAADAKP